MNSKSSTFSEKRFQAAMQTAVKEILKKGTPELRRNRIADLIAEAAQVAIDNVVEDGEVLVRDTHLVDGKDEYLLAGRKWGPRRGTRLVKLDRR